MSNDYGLSNALEKKEAFVRFTDRIMEYIDFDSHERYQEVAQAATEIRGVDYGYGFLDLSEDFFGALNEVLVNLSEKDKKTWAFFHLNLGFGLEHSDRFFELSPLDENVTIGELEGILSSD